MYAIQIFSKDFPKGQLIGVADTTNPDLIIVTTYANEYEAKDMVELLYRGQGDIFMRAVPVPSVMAYRELPKLQGVIHNAVCEYRRTQQEKADARKARGLDTPIKLQNYYIFCHQAALAQAEIGYHHGNGHMGYRTPLYWETLMEENREAADAAEEAYIAECEAKDHARFCDMAYGRD